MKIRIFLAAAVAVCSISACAPSSLDYDVIIRGGTLYDGLGGEPFVGDIAIRGDRISAIGNLADTTANQEIDATGKAVSPGFINMLSWATASLIADGRGMSDLKQGVTLEVMGEGWSMGPWNDRLKADAVARQGTSNSISNGLRSANTWNT